MQKEIITVPQTVSHLRDLIRVIGEDPEREGLVETPARIIRAAQELFSGYHQNVADLFKVFDAEDHDQIVLLKNIEFFSMCEHHCLPFIGRAHVAYIPSKKVIGISKLARLVDCYAKRMQIQERMTDQITAALMKYLEPQGAACVIEASHMCMKMRGIKKQNSEMITSSVKGVFFTRPAARRELMALIKN